MPVLDCRMTYIAKRLFLQNVTSPVSYRYSGLLSFLLHCINYLMLNKKLETSQLSKQFQLRKYPSSLSHQQTNNQLMKLSSNRCSSSYFPIPSHSKTFIKDLVIFSFYTYISLMLLACHKKFRRNLEVRNLKILRNICLFSSICLCPLGCLSFVR